MLASGGCDKTASTEADSKPAAAPRKLAGVVPEQWKCESVATLDQLSQLLGGAAHPLDSAIAPPRGVPHPCSYVIDTTPQEQWTFDLYCRDDYKQQADALFTQYRQDSADLVARYEAAAKGSNGKGSAGALKNDAGVAFIAPEAAADVAVGAKGLDHHGRGLIFVDDDAPCYVRIVGLDPQKRMDLAKLVAKNLTFDNAPMQPRPAK